jgi:iron complex outermembrane receptor protein
MKISVRYARRGAMSVVAGVVAAIIGNTAFAQELEEVVVTATRRQENVQNVPIAVTAVTAAQLESKGINDVAKLSALAPNVTLDAGTPFSGSDTVLAAYIRGIGQNDFAFNQDPGVGVYVDGVYLARSVGSNTSMLDVDRVEILKGPQGTLFGRNTIGGAISIVTRDPGDQFMFKGSVTTGSFNRMDVQATADLPFSDTIRSSLSFSSARRDGYQRRIAFTDLANKTTAQTGNPFALIADCNGGLPGGSCGYSTDDSRRFPAAGYASGDREGGVDQWSARGKLVFLPSEAVKLTLSADYQNVDQSASPNTALAINPAILDSLGNPAGLGGLYNLCLSGFGPPNIPGLPCGPRGGNPTTPTQMALLPGLAGINNDGNPQNNTLPYDNRFQTGNIDTTYATGNSFSKLKNWGIAATLEWDLAEGMNLKSITAYRDLHWFTGMDLDGSPLPILEPSFQMPQHETSEELQLNGKAIDDRLNYTVGAYYFKEAGHLHDYVIFPGGILMIDGPNDLDTKARALFTHLNFKVTEQFGITVGARYTKETKHFEGHQNDDNALTYSGTPPGTILAPGQIGPFAACLVPLAPASAFGITTFAPGTAKGGQPIGNANCREYENFGSDAEPYRFYPTGTQTLEFSNTSPTVGGEFHITPDMMLYANYSKGYKTGSWTTRLSAPHPVFDSSLDFDPEHATAEEIGFKSELLDRRLRLNLAAFHTKYSGIQLNSQQGISPTLVNAGDARIYGFEAEAEALLGGGFALNAAFGYTNAKYITLNNVVDNGATLTLNSCPLRTSDPNSRCDLPKTPKYKVYIGPQYTASLGSGGAITFNADYTYTAKLFNDLGNEELLKRDATNIVNASVTYAAPDDKWEFVVGGSNLTDERYIVSGQNQGGVAVIDAVYSRPREWFATVRVNMK